MTSTGGGKRAGSRRAARRKRSWRWDVASPLLAAAALLVGWGFLVKAAIDFGHTAQQGRSEAWWFLGVACAGAIACLFAALMLVVRALRRLGVVGDRENPSLPHEFRTPGHRH